MTVELRPRIVVIGVGGAGGNAVNNMIDANLQGVEFVVANTDAQALVRSKAPTQIQLGVARTAGLGAGANPEVGMEAAKESSEELKKLLSGAHMCFIAAGMGGGTGTGAAPIIARIAKEQKVLTVGVVTKPFDFEGKRRMQVAEKGIAWTRLRTTGTPGHGSMPHGDNAAIKLAAAVTAIADDQAKRPMRVIPVVAEFLAGIGLEDVAQLAERDPAAALKALEASVADPVLRRSIDAMLRDTVTPNVMHAGKKVNVIPGAGEAEIDVRTLPGTDQRALLEHLQEVVGADASVESVVTLPAVEWPADAEIVALMHEALRTADPEATSVPMMITPGTDAKALAEIGIPCYGFAPLRLEPDVPFLSVFHGHDERIPVSALAFGLPVLADVVASFVLRT